MARLTRRVVAGIDEVGRGPLAGPVVAVAVVLTRRIAGIGDSKAIKAEVRRELARELMGCAKIGVGAVCVDEIDRINILQATWLAMRRALARLPVRPDLLMVDGNRAPAFGIATECVVGGDALVEEIGAASIVAKVIRDRLMHRLAPRYPGYGFERHVGYPTSEHLAALRALGATRHHRRSFAPVARLALPLS